MATSQLGSTERTNELLQQASKQTGIAAPTFTIPTSSMTPATPLQIPTPTQDTTNYGGITGGISDSIINEYKILNQQLTDRQNSQEKAGTDITKLMESLTNRTADTQQANEMAGVNAETENLNKYVSQLADLNAQASSLNREAQAIPLITQERNANTGATDAGIAPQNAGDLRKNAIKALSIGQLSDIAAAAATGSNMRLQAAKDKAQQIIDLKYKPIEDMLAIKEKQYELNKDVLMSIDKRRAEALGLAIDKEKTALADKKSQENQIADIKIDLAKKGVDASVLDKLEKATTVNEALSIAFPYLKTPNTDIVKLDNGSTIMIDKNTGAIIKNYGGAKPNESTTNNLSFISDYNTYRNNAISNGQTPVDMATYNDKVKSKNTALQTILASGKFTKEQKADLVNAINSGQDAFSVIKNQAKNIMGQTLATDLDKAETAKSQLQHIDTLLDQFYANGGHTNIFTGTFEKTLNKLGQIDKKELVSIASEIALAMQEYRLAVTGTAASVQEDAKIDNVFPGISNSQGLNEARLNAALKSFDQKIDAKYRNTLGNTYDSLKSSEESVNKSSQQLLQEANEAKSQVNDFWQKSDGATQEMVMSLFNKGFNDIEVIEYLKSKKLIQ